MAQMSLKSSVRRVVVKLGLKPLLWPLWEVYQGLKFAKLVKQYNSGNTAFGLNTDKRDFELTVSFTTYPARIGAAVYVADAILRQTLKPDRVILVLAEEEFKSKEELPKDYANLEKRGLTIVFEQNLKPHKKYHYAMSHYRDSIIVTVDDDSFYPENLLETLISTYKQFPNAIAARRAHRILFADGKLLPYNDWARESEYTDKPALDLIAVGIGGVLYPPNCLSEYADTLLDIELIMNTALSADDIWLKFIELQCGVPVVVSGKQPRHPPTVPGSQKTSLVSTNVNNKRNEIAIKNCMQLLGYSDADLYTLMGDAK